jgi:hypothetical protein
MSYKLWKVGRHLDGGVLPFFLIQFLMRKILSVAVRFGLKYISNLGGHYYVRQCETVRILS